VRCFRNSGIQRTFYGKGSRSATFANKEGRWFSEATIYEAKIGGELNDTLTTQKQRPPVNPGGRIIWQAICVK
jgi:hypothetical protein